MENVFIVDNNLCLNIFMDDENIFCSFILVSDTNDLFRENIFQIVLFSAKETEPQSLNVLCGCLFSKYLNEKIISLLIEK